MSLIREDELKDHALLEELHKTTVGTETLTEDMIWRNSPWHGSPGG